MSTTAAAAAADAAPTAAHLKILGDQRHKMRDPAQGRGHELVVHPWEPTACALVTRAGRRRQLTAQRAVWQLDAQNGQKRRLVSELALWAA
jgi:hypothetical protein